MRFSIFSLIIFLFVGCASQNQVFNDWINRLNSTAILRRVVNDNVWNAGTAVCIARAVASDIGWSDIIEDSKFAYIFLTVEHVVYPRFPEGFPFADSEPRFELISFLYDENGCEQSKSTVHQNDKNHFYFIVNRQYDLALVALITDVELNIEPVPIIHESMSGLLTAGQSAVATMSPSILRPVLKWGRVSQVENDVDLILDIGVSAGSSGGPVFNSNGDMIGIIWGKYNCTTAIANTAQEIYDFLRENGIGISTMETYNDE